MKYKFKDGDETGHECPKCGKKLMFEMSFMDCFSNISGHYTTDRPIMVCEDDINCKFFEDYIPEDEYDGEM